MARIFLSYSRVDRRFVDALADKLRRIYGHDNVWFDEGLHGGDIWWEEILEQIASRDIFIYVLSNDSIQSAYCQAEFTEARRLQKQIITVQARDRTRLTDELGDIHYINMANGVDDADALTDLYRSVNKRMTKVPRRTPKPLWEPPTPRPGKLDEKPRPADAPDVETPTLEVPLAERENVRVDGKPWWKKPEFVIGAILIPILAAVLGAVIQNMGSNNTPTPPSPTTEVALPTDEPSPSITLTLSTTPSETPTLSETEVEGTVQAQMNAIVLDNARTAEAAETATAEQVRQYERGTAAALTITATNWTATPTIDTRATAEARLTATQLAAIALATTDAQRTLTAYARETQQAATVTQAWIDSWTATPTATLTPSNTPTPTRTPDATATLIAFRPQRNADWTPIEREFNGVTMVLVPAGCFVMGNDSEAYFWNGTSYVQDVPDGEEQCFDEPFWVDKTEVIQADFERLGGEQADPPDFDGANRPVEDITWFEARDFCALRGGRLPTEAEWEYVARGPDELYFPWGNSWNENNAVWNRDSSQGTADVGSIPAGISWVGALDMSGNVWEWTRSIYEDYPYVAGDGREADLGEETNVRYTFRGGSWGNTVENLRSATRGWGNPSLWGNGYGFRCVLSYE